MINKQNINMTTTVLAQNNLMHYALTVDRNYEVNWHHRLIWEKLEQVAKWKIKRLILNLPPRHGKSHLSAILFPSWILWKYPDKKIMLTSYSASLAETFSRQCRNLMYTDVYKSLFKTRIADDSRSIKEWSTTEWWQYIAAWIWWSITGKWFDIWILDDPVANREEAESATIRNSTYDWFTSTFLSRQSPNAAIIIIQTRWHQDDCSGRVIELQNQLNKKWLKWEDWDILNLPAIATEDEIFRKKWEALWANRYGTWWLNNLKTSIWIRDFNSLYQGDPVPIDTGDFTKDMFRYYDYEAKENLRIVIFVDPAISQEQTADYTAIMTIWLWENNKIYILDYLRKRMTPSELIDVLFDTVRYYKPEKVWIEDVWFQKMLIYEIQKQMDLRNYYFTLDSIFPKWKKEERIRWNLQPRYSSWKIYHKKCECDELEEELLSFPASRHDDLSDSLSYAVYMLNDYDTSHINQINDLILHEMRMDYISELSG